MPITKEQCGKCGEEAPVKKDGNLWKHATPDGEPCDCVTPLSEDTPSDEGEPIPLAEKIKDRLLQGAPKAESPPPHFDYVVSVNKPCPFLDEADWQNRNKSLAWRQAEREGLRPRGEVRLFDTSDAKDRILLVYRIDLVP